MLAIFHIPSFFFHYPGFFAEPVCFYFAVAVVLIPGNKCQFRTEEFKIKLLLSTLG
jgi:hypothetical protein